MKTIILASSSPRRIELLSRYDIDPIIMKAEIQERISPEESPQQIAMALAFEKANKIAGQLDLEGIIIGADTIVACGGRILEKPKNEEEAKETLRFLSDKEHEVITGIGLIGSKSNVKVIDYEKTIVKFRKLSSKKIKNYIKTGECMDKAGAYGIQGIGGVLIERIDGCFFNVMGLPLYKLDILLEKYFDISLL